MTVVPATPAAGKLIATDARPRDWRARGDGRRRGQPTSSSSGPGFARTPSVDDSESSRRCSSSPSCHRSTANSSSWRRSSRSSERERTAARAGARPTSDWAPGSLVATSNGRLPRGMPLTEMRPDQGSRPPAVSKIARNQPQHRRRAARRRPDQRDVRVLRHVERNVERGVADGAE